MGEEKKDTITGSKLDFNEEFHSKDDIPHTYKTIIDCTPNITERARIWKNVLLISFAFLCNFNAFQGLSRLQSSLHRDQGMGVTNNAVLYSGLVVSCLFVPRPLINLIGHRWTIPLCFGGYMLWMAANGHAIWGTMVPASIIVGVAAAPLWTAQCAYFTKIAGRYAQLTKQAEQTVVTMFFGVFFMFFQTSNITGSIISSTVLAPNRSAIQPPSDEALAYCGVNDCPDKPENLTNPNLDRVDSNTLWTMVGIYLGIAVIGILVVSLFVDNLPPELDNEKRSGCSENVELLLATLKQMADPVQIILIPLTMYSGFEQAFYNADFTNSFITCGVGIWKVGLVTLPYGIVNAFVSFFTGQLVKYTGRIPVFAAGVVVDLSIQITLMNWMPTPKQEYVLYILAGLWGLTDGIWQTQINALYGCLFPHNPEAAFSNYRLWESVGFIIAFAYNPFLCTGVKLYVVTGFLLLGMLGYVYAEFRIRKMEAQSGDIEPKGLPISSEGDKKGIENEGRITYM